MLFRKILLVIFLLVNFNGYSQSRRFTHLTSEDGISQSEVYSFLKDSRGFVWFGTIDGLNRYDGYEIEIFNTKRNDPHALSNNTIRSLKEDHLGRIWIGTNDGLNVYDPESGLINQMNIKANNSNFFVWDILMHNGQLFVGTKNGLWKTSIQTDDLENIENGFQHINNLQNITNIRSLIASKNGGIWLLSDDCISRIEFHSNSSEPAIIEKFCFNELAPAIAFVEDFSSNIWIALTKNGLIRYNFETKQYNHFNKYETSYGPASRKCSALELDKNGNLWIGTLDKGLNFVKAGELHKDELLFETVKYEPFYSYGLNSNLIYSLYVSEDNLLWVGTIGSGVNIYNPNQKEFYHYKFKHLLSDSPNSNFIRSVYVDSQNRIWIGTHNNGLFIFDRNNENFQKLGFETESVFYIRAYRQGKVLICTSTGVYIVEFIKGKARIINNFSYNDVNDGAFYIENSKSNIFWIATLRGLVRAEIDNNSMTLDKIYSTLTDPGISSDNCRVLLYNDVENKLYVGTEGGGLNVVWLDDEHYPQKIEIYKNTKEPGSISNNYIRSIVKDRHQNIWIGTYEGLNKMMRNDSTGEVSFQLFTKEDGLPNNMIQSLVEDNYNSLWVGTNGGLSQFNQAEEKFINFTTGDGIQSNEFSEHAAYKKTDGEIVMGGINGLTIFYPDQIEVSSQQPQTTITAFHLFNEIVEPFEKIGKKAPLQKSISLTDTIILLPSQNNFGFDFSAMVYPTSEKVQYAYMLKGFDTGWHYAGKNERNANYTNLRNGDYTFMVKSTNSDGIWEETPKEVFIHIKTPFLLSWIAFVLYGIIAIAIILNFSYFSVILYSTKKKLLLEKEHDKKIHELDVLRTKFFINISHDLRTPLTLISEPLSSMLRKKNRTDDDNEKLQLIKRNVKRLSYLVEQLLDVRKAESAKLSPKLKSEELISFLNNEVAHFSYALTQKGLKLNVNSKSEEITMFFDRKMISKVCFNIISNAIKFTDQGKIEINIEKVKKGNYEIFKNAPFESFVKVEVRDTGTGIPQEQRDKIFDRYYQGQEHKGKGYGIGLSHTKELIDAHNGYIEVESEEGKGTTMRFFLPEITVFEKTEKNIAASTEDIYYDAEPVSATDERQVKDSAKTVLVVEDNTDMRNYIAAELKDTYNTIKATDGVEGLKKSYLILPDLIVCDVMMPNMNGIEFCKRIKSNIETSHIPVILLTAKIDKDTKYEGIEIGADDYIPKPFEIDYLKIRIKNLLQSRELLRQRFQNSFTVEPSSVTVTNIDKEFLATLISEMEAGIPDPEFSVSILEEKMGMSHANFYRKVKSLTGQSGMKLLLDMRMKRAHQILSENKGIRVTEVAYMVGFKNSNHFGKCFKNFYGTTPSEFMNMQ